MYCDWNKINNELSNAVIDAGRLEELLEEIGCTSVLPTRSGGFRATCPIHNGDGQNLQVRVDGYSLPIYWKCFSGECHKKQGLMPSLIGLVRGAISTNIRHLVHPREAQQFLEAFLSRSPSMAVTPFSKATEPAKRTAPKCSRERIRERLHIPSPYFVQRGFDPTILDTLDVGDSDSLHRAVIPIYDEGGSTYVGFVSRSKQPLCGQCQQCHQPFENCDCRELRWKFPQDFACSDWLYNHHAVAQSPLPFTLLVEGVPDVFRAAEAGVPAVAAFGVNISPMQTEKLVSLRKKVVVAFDNDEAGRKHAVTTAMILQREGLVCIVRHPPHGVKDIGEMKASEVAAWIQEVMPSIPC